MQAQARALVCVSLPLTGEAGDGRTGAVGLKDTARRFVPVCALSVPFRESKKYLLLRLPS